MMFNCSNCAKESPMFAKKFLIGGDGESTSLRIALDCSPVAMTFVGGKRPSTACVRERRGGNGEVAVSIDNNLLMFQFQFPPAKGERIEVDVEFYYSSI